MKSEFEKHVQYEIKNCKFSEIAETMEELRLPVPNKDEFGKSKSSNIYMPKHGASIRFYDTTKYHLTFSRYLLRPIASIQTPSGVRIDIQPLGNQFFGNVFSRNFLEKGIKAKDVIKKNEGLEIKDAAPENWCYFWKKSDDPEANNFFNFDPGTVKN